MISTMGLKPIGEGHSQNVGLDFATNLGPALYFEYASTLRLYPILSIQQLTNTI
jgi:hypothetical protein